MTATRTTPTKALVLRRLGYATIALHPLARVEVTIDGREPASLYQFKDPAARHMANLCYHLIGRTESFLDAYLTNMGNRADGIRDDLERDAFYSAINDLSGKCADGCCGPGADFPADAEQARHQARVAWAADLVGRALGYEPAPLRAAAERAEAVARNTENGA